MIGPTYFYIIINQFILLMFCLLLWLYVNILCFIVYIYIYIKYMCVCTYWIPVAQRKMIGCMGLWMTSIGRGQTLFLWGPLAMPRPPPGHMPWVWLRWCAACALHGSGPAVPGTKAVMFWTVSGFIWDVQNWKNKYNDKGSTLKNPQKLWKPCFK